MFMNATKFGDYFKLPNPGLRAYFEHVVTGQPDVYSTPFAKNNGSLTNLLQEWLNHVEQLRASYPTLYDYEIDLSKKVGPMSVMKPLVERISDIDAYYDLISKDQAPVLDGAITAALSEWRQVAGLRMRNRESTLANMRLNTNSGSPFFTKRSRVLNDTVPCRVYAVGEDILQDLGSDQWHACAVLGWRGQEGGPSPADVKQRVVWMFPFAVNIEELRVYQPLIAAMQRGYLPAVPAWNSLDAVDTNITLLFDSKGPKDLVMCTDFSKFDQHFNPVCSGVAATCIKHLFKGDPWIEDWLENVFPIKYRIPLAYDYGKIRTGLHGMGSGSGGTNGDETITHRVLQHEAAITSNQILNSYSMCLGDDGVLTYPHLDPEHVMQWYCSHGLEMNPDKQYLSTQDCIYLRRWHSTLYRVRGVCVGVYATTRALGRLCMQERFYDPDKWGPKMVALRQLSIIENCKWHPLREEFARFCMEKDKFRLGIDIPGFLDNIEREAREAIEYLPDFLGYTRSLERGEHPTSTGISNWWIVNYLKSLA